MTISLKIKFKEITNVEMEKSLRQNMSGVKRIYIVLSEVRFIQLVEYIVNRLEIMG